MPSSSPSLDKRRKDTTEASCQTVVLWKDDPIWELAFLTRKNSTKTQPNATKKKKQDDQWHCTQCAKPPLPPDAPSPKSKSSGLGPSSQLKHCQIGDFLLNFRELNVRKEVERKDVLYFIYTVYFFSRQYIITYISKCVIHLHMYNIHILPTKLQERMSFHQERLRLRMLPGHAKASVVPCC